RRRRVDDGRRRYAGLALAGALGVDHGTEQKPGAREVQARVPAPTVVYAPAPAATAPSATAAPQQVTIINNFYGASPMSAANRLFGR
ncbi:MAG: hypothetical protein ACKOTF_06455, partial [Opitutaceae bacterium]